MHRASPGKDIENKDYPSHSLGAPPPDPRDFPLWANGMIEGRCGVPCFADTPGPFSLVGRPTTAMIGNWKTGTRRTVAPAHGSKVLSRAGSPIRSKRKRFNAVAESRRWKEAVAKEIAGMTPEETVAYFDRAAVGCRFEAALRRAEQAGEVKGEGGK